MKATSIITLSSYPKHYYAKCSFTVESGIGVKEFNQAFQDRLLNKYNNKKLFILI